MSLFVVVFCILLLILVSAMQQWKLLVLLAVLFVGAAVTLMWYNSKLNRENPHIRKGEIETVHIFYGSEKKAFLENLEFQEMLRKKHGLVIKGIRTDALEMPEDLRGKDGFWPSCDLAAVRFKEQHPDFSYKTENIFHTPLVLCSWSKVTEFLIRQKIVEKREDRHVVAIGKLLNMGKRRWEDFRISGIPGPILFKSANPGQSTAGLLSAGLTAIALNGNKTPDGKDAEGHMPEIRKIFEQMGRKESAADILFNRYLKQGMSRWPIISACENQVVEYYQTFPRHQEKIRAVIRVLIPEPTVRSEHPFLSFTEKGDMLLAALRDREIQELAWKKFGFRSGLPGVRNHPGELKAIGLPDQIEAIAPMPSVETMERIVGGVRDPDTGRFE